MYHLLIPGKPLPKERPRLGKGRTYTSTKTKNQEKFIQAHALKSRIVPIQGDVRLFLCFFGAHHAADTDNLIKLPLDALNGMAYKDDRQVTDIHAFKRDVLTEPLTAILIGPISEEINLPEIVEALLQGQIPLSSA